ncbi:hypothetical protein HYALB_00011893 [Hymenoscyphus albidus]|uniref:Xylanolytic transcriptional activator regulatory domain-containing protein n=1 Tax=Hymenoscyphus albidus TaxID=595503 RepID=A0A9N9LQK2_9HELO|nr:hypothetical protein HYALB_00011893 [Hymenoscyphus albidus]
MAANSEYRWKAGMQTSSQQLQAAVGEILNVLNLPKLSSFGPNAPPVVKDGSPMPQRLVPFDSATASQMEQRTSPQETIEVTPRTMPMTRENSIEPETSQEDTLIGAPMGTLYEVTKLRHLRNPEANDSFRSPLETDFISRGDIDIQDALDLFGVFNRSLNHYLWGGIALVHSNLESVRKSSSLLLAAILGVTALHIPGKAVIFDICYAEFTSLVSNSMLNRSHCFDTVRGLCIGAFWISDLSWKLSGHAVRIGTELNLHRSYYKARKTNGPEHMDAARLWYLLYVCDHHFSIAFGRPPVIHEDQAIANHENFLKLPGTAQPDLRLLSQVALFIILTKMYNTFGPDIDHILEEYDLALLRGFNMDLDGWRMRWESQLDPNPFISTYPSKGVALHYHFSKLQLNSLSLRGFKELPPTELSPSRREYANLAISSAISILQLVITQQDIREGLVGVPLYLQTMITYAAVFLHKVQRKWKSLHLVSDATVARELIQQTIDILKRVRASERHLAYQIANGLAKMLDRAKIEDQSSSSNPATGIPGYEASDIAPFSVYGDSMDLFDEHYFPLGFFDVTSITGAGPHMNQDDRIIM